MGYLEVHVTVPDQDADRLATTLVHERLAACAQVLHGLRSIYVWEGDIESAAEALLLLKTRDDLFDTLVARVTELHPYDVPEVVAVPITRLSPAYAGWLAQTLDPPPAADPVTPPCP